MLILIPVLFAMVMGVSYQFEQKAKAEVDGLSMTNVKQSTSLFIKGVHMVKAICGVATENVW